VSGLADGVVVMHGYAERLYHLDDHLNYIQGRQN
jgi:hypothetical protein